MATKNGTSIPIRKMTWTSYYSGRHQLLRAIIILPSINFSSDFVTSASSVAKNRQTTLFATQCFSFGMFVGRTVAKEARKSAAQNTRQSRAAAVFCTFDFDKCAIDRPISAMSDASVRPVWTALKYCNVARSR